MEEAQGSPGKNVNVKHVNTQHEDKISLTEILAEFLKRHPSLRGQGTAKPSGGGVRTMNCLCSPTTHAGSFRCRHHRLGGMTRSGGSIGSNLSLLAASKGTSISDTLQAQ